VCEFPGLNLSPGISYPEVSYGFPQSLQAVGGKLLNNRPLSLSSTSFPFHSSLITLLFNNTYIIYVTEKSLNKPKI
jgi:hypothetical protein